MSVAVDRPWDVDDTLNPVADVSTHMLKTGWNIKRQFEIERVHVFLSVQERVLIFFFFETDFLNIGVISPRAVRPSIVSRTLRPDL